MGSESIDLSLGNLYRCWRLFRVGKIASREIIEFEYYLEDNLRRLQVDLAGGDYQHGDYRQFEVTDNKRRLIRVAPVRDRIVHRLIYEYLKPIFDQTFGYDAWSCREGKGLIGAINRSQEFLRRRPNGYIWRADICKFFDSVDKAVLLGIIKRRVQDDKALKIITTIIFSGTIDVMNSGPGIPIGNLTSQIFANIYLNELDRFVKHDLRIKYYLRYGDDFIIGADCKADLDYIRVAVKQFLQGRLHIKLNSNHDIIINNGSGLRFLGVVVYPWRRRLNRRNRKRLLQRVDLGNFSSYSGLVGHYELDQRLALNYLGVDLLNDL